MFSLFHPSAHPYHQIFPWLQIIWRISFVFVPVVLHIQMAHMYIYNFDTRLSLYHILSNVSN